MLEGLTSVMVEETLGFQVRLQVCNMTKLAGCVRESGRQSSVRRSVCVRACVRVVEDLWRSVRTFLSV